MFQFDNIITAGTILVRQQIESQNWESSGHTAGWAILANGDAYFLNITAAGDITADSLSTGPPPGRRVVIDSGSSPDVNAGIEFYSGIVGPPSQTEPDAIYSFNNPLALTIDGLMLQAGSMSDGDSGSEPSLLLGPSTNGVPGFIWFQYIAGTFGKLFMDFDPDICLKLKNTTDVSVASTEHAFQIGEDFARNIAIDDNEIQARNAFAAATLALNASGGIVTTGDTIRPGASDAAHAFDGNTRTTTSITYVAASGTADFTMPYPASGAVLICLASLLDNTGAADSANVSFEIRDTNAAGTLRAAASDNYRCYSVGTTADQRSTQRLIVGLPTTGTMFVRPMIRSSVVTNTASMNNTEICAIPVL